MRFDILTIFPEMFASVINCSIQKRATDSGLISYHIHNIRDYAKGKHKNTDDYPFGGGNGMVMMPQPIFDCINAVKKESNDVPYCIMMTPRGRMLTTKVAKKLSEKKRILLLCGHYEGIDERVMSLMDDEISTGDYVLTGGELPAMVLCDCVSRFIPGVLGTSESAEDESFSLFGGDLLEYPQYTRPANFNGMIVPSVLQNGNHADITNWRRKQSIIKTAQNRPELLSTASLTPEELCLAGRITGKLNTANVIKVELAERTRLRVFTSESFEQINKISSSLHWHDSGYIYVTNIKKPLDAYKYIMTELFFNLSVNLAITNETVFENTSEHLKNGIADLY